MADDDRDEQRECPAEAKPKEVCEECKTKPSKYKCPGCSLRSCSLPCVKSHKLRTGCSGKRDQTQFIPISEFDDNALLSDYNMLEEVKRISESAQRMRSRLCPYPSFRLPYHYKSLRSAAASRRTKLLFLPSGMSKRDKNKSRYDQRNKSISWTIEWRFHSTNVVIIDHGVNEESTLSSVIETHLEPGPWKNQLRQFCEEQLDKLKFFIRKYPKGSKSPFYELNIKAPIRQQLANVVLLEYPVIHVFLPSHNYDFEVIKVDPVDHKLELKDHDDQHSPKGITFREEEIKEDNLDSKVIDLSKHMSSPMRQISPQNEAENLINGSLPLLPKAAMGSCLESGQLDIFEEMDFEFDQSLIDAYTNLIAETDPDGFLDLEGEDVLANCLEIADKENLFDPNGVTIPEDELEEGEIQE